MVSNFIHSARGLFMFISTKTSHMLLLQEIRALKQEIAQANNDWNEIQAASLMGEIAQLKEQVDEMRARWVPMPVEKKEPAQPREFNSQSRQ